MATTTIETPVTPPIECPPGYKPLQLRTPYGLTHRLISTAPPRVATATEIPIIDISRIYGDFSSRVDLAAEIKEAATTAGIFYIQNHGIDSEIIEKAYKQAVAFFKQPVEKKELAGMHMSKWFNGWQGKNKSVSNEGGELGKKEVFFWRYNPKYDPEIKDLSSIPDDIKAWLRYEEFVWEGTEHLPNFKEDVLRYWQACLTLARRLVRIFALCLELPETYFDSITTYPGSDGVFNFYPGASRDTTENRGDDMRLGAHTDLQSFTLLWQDMHGGLQVLNPSGQWLLAKPIEGTFVVNIADFLQRLSNGKLVSTVHRVHRLPAEGDRISMPFFFGFNYNEKCKVVDTCVDETNPAKYEPISCGEWCEMRFKQGF